jgi:hypothetical protein
MKTILLLAFASLTNPLRIVKSIQDKFRRVTTLQVAWRNPGPPKVPCKEMINNPGYWDAEWFNNYE